MAYNDIYRLRIYQRMHTAQVVNVIHFVEDLAAVGGGAAGIANDFVTNMTATLKARASRQVTFDYVECQSIVPFVGGPVVVNFPASTLGTVSEDAASATLCEVVTVYSQRGGRRGRGRMFLPPGGTVIASAQNGTWGATQTGRTTAFATAMATRYIGIAGTVAYCLGVWSKVMGPQFPPWSSSQFARATGLTVRTTIRTQRRRQLGVGR
jgi:hypothetical protein